MLIFDANPRWRLHFINPTRIPEGVEREKGFSDLDRNLSDDGNAAEQGENDDQE